MQIMKEVVDLFQEFLVGLLGVKPPLSGGPGSTRFCDPVFELDPSRFVPGSVSFARRGSAYGPL